VICLFVQEKWRFQRAFQGKFGFVTSPFWFCTKDLCFYTGPWHRTNSNSIWIYCTKIMTTCRVCSCQILPKGLKIVKNFPLRNASESTDRGNTDRGNWTWNSCDCQNYQQVFTGVPVHIKHVFLGVHKFLKTSFHVSKRSHCHSKEWAGKSPNLESEYFKSDLLREPEWYSSIVMMIALT